MIYPHHFESSVSVAAAPGELFAELDDHARLVAHMTRSSTMMAGSSMQFSFDETRGQAVGSKITMKGSMLGLKLWLEEIVTDRTPPARKVWETVGEPRLFVIGGYRMGFEITPEEDGSRLTVFIDYQDSPAPWRWLGRLLGSAYAKWCTQSMAKGAAGVFSSRAGSVRTATSNVAV